MKSLGTKAATVAAALITTSAIAVAPSVQAPARPVPEIRLTAEVQQLATRFDPLSLTDWITRIVTPPSLGAAGPPLPQPPPPVVDPQNIDSTTKAIYYAVEPWVHSDFSSPSTRWVGYLNVDTLTWAGSRLRSTSSTTSGKHRPQCDLQHHGVAD